jgi:ribonuclease-3
MRRIKPGLIAGSVKPKKHERGGGVAGLPSREVWDDFEATHKHKQKKVYSRSEGNRFVEDKKSAQVEREEPASQPEVENYQPRGDYEFVEGKLAYEFKDRSLLERALTHRSALRARDRADYERLEFLGDAVLGLCVAHLLSDLHPDATEGKLSKMRAALVNTQALADIARKLEFGQFIKLGRGEISSGGFDRPSILADVTEAVFGAVYRDSSYDNVLEKVAAIFEQELQQVTPYDPKTELQEILHQEGSDVPSYLVELVEGPVHAPIFVVVVKVDGEIAGRGRGPTKKSAQQAAAAEVISRLTPSNSALVVADAQTLFAPELMLVMNEEQTGFQKQIEQDEVSDDVR